MWFTPIGWFAWAWHRRQIRRVFEMNETRPASSFVGSVIVSWQKRHVSRFDIVAWGLREESSALSWQRKQRAFTGSPFSFRRTATPVPSVIGSWQVRHLILPSEVRGRSFPGFIVSGRVIRTGWHASIAPWHEWQIRMSSPAYRRFVRISSFFNRTSRWHPWQAA